MFEFNYLSLLCNTNTLWNILIILGTNVEQDEMKMLHTRMTTLAGFWFWGGGGGGGGAEFGGTFVFF